MKTMLRIGLIWVGLLTMWVACFEKALDQSLSNAPQPPAEMQSLEKALAGKWSTTYDFEPGGIVCLIIHT